jgi:Flp pilus assembly protein TadD
MGRALHFLQGCLDRSPEDRWTAEVAATALERRARQLLQEGSLAEAEADLLRAIALLPWNAKIPYRLGEARLTASGGDPASPHLPLALQTFDLALRLSPHHEEAMAHRAVCLSLLGRDAEAEEAFRSALEVRPDSVVVLFNYATHLAQRGRTADALAHAEEAHRHHPGFRGLADLLARLRGGG